MTVTIKYLFLFLLLISLLFCRYGYEIRRQWRLPSIDVLKPVGITGVIDSVPKKQFHGLRFLFKVSSFQGRKVSTTMLLSWYHHPPSLSVGQQWQLTVKLKPPVGLHNPGGFDYQQWLIQHDISSTGYVVSALSQKLLSPSKGYRLLNLRMQIEQAVFKAVSDTKIAAVLSALSVGLRDQLQKQDWQVFQRTGTSHLVAISGLHIGLVASAVFILLQCVACFIPRLLLYCPAAYIGQMGSLLFALLYTALSGFALPAQRALVMIACFIFSELFFINIAFYKRLLIALLLIIFVSPFSIFSASLWLSFFAVFILGYLLCCRLRPLSGLSAWVNIQIFLTIALLPITLWYFHQISTVSMIANAMAIPWVSFVVLPCILIAVLFFLCHLTPLVHPVFWLSGELLKPLWVFLRFLSHYHGSFWVHYMFSPWLLLLALIGVFILLAPSGMPARWLGCFGFLPLFFYHPKPPKPGDFWVTVLDVGQGLSVVVQTAQHTLVYDTGLHVPQGFDAGEQVVLPFLQRQGIYRINRMVISHGDNDHSGGAAAIVSVMPVLNVLSSAPKFVKRFYGKFCHAGQAWAWDGIYFQMLSPQAGAPYQDNNSSCVLKISNAAGTILLTGDIEKSQERVLVHQYARKLSAGVLVVAHHGSRTSSSRPFLSAVAPRYAVISLGAYNRYHFPGLSVVQRLRHQGAKMYTTAKNGAISIRFLQAGQVRLALTTTKAG